MLFNFFFLRALHDRRTNASFQAGRGNSPNFFFGDEFAYIAKRVILELVIPFYLIEGVCIMLACSPSRDASLARYLQRVIHPITGKYLFKTIALVEVCADCKKRKVPEECTHMLLNKSELKTRERTAAALAMYPPEHRDIGEREILGMPGQVTGHLTEAEITDFLTSAPYDIEFSPNAIFLGIDPGGGGKSHTAICAFIYYPIGSIPNMRLVRNTHLLEYQTPGCPGKRCGCTASTSCVLQFVSHFIVAKR